MKRVLVIDDSEINLCLMNSIFERSKEIKIILEPNSSQALQTIIRVMPDLIVLDLMMPEVNGFQLLERLKTDETLSSIPVLIISARYDSQAVKQANEYGVAGYIKKPIDLKFVEQRIKHILKLNKD